MTDSSLLPLPTHPDGLAWPTREWPRAALDPRVDRAALEKLLDHAFRVPEPDDLERTHSVVIVQHGAIVAERHAHDVDPDDAFLSWSMAKSITSALIGILVRDERIDIGRPASIREWDAGDPRSRITVDQMLRMVDGLRFREAEHLGEACTLTRPLLQRHLQKARAIVDAALEQHIARDPGQLIDPIDHRLAAQKEPGRRRPAIAPGTE